MYSKKFNSVNKNLELREDLFCKFCNKQCKNLNSLKQHECRCKQNPERKESAINTLSNRGWAKGLTKGTDERIKNNSDSKKEYYKTHSGTFLGKHHSQETKDLLSKIQTEIDHSASNRNSHGKRGYYDGIFFMSTWELAYYIYVRDNMPNTKIERCSKRFKYFYEDKYHYYTPDFILNDSTIVEIKGWETELDRIKYELVQNIQVLYYNNIKPMIKYVQETYNVQEIADLYSPVA